VSYYIKYKVVGIPQEFLAGPYSFIDLEYHMQDIRAFENVYDVYVDLMTKVENKENYGGN